MTDILNTEYYTISHLECFGGICTRFSGHGINQCRKEGVSCIKTQEIQSNTSENVADTQDTLRYNCVSGNCIESPDGIHTSVDECHKTCDTDIVCPVEYNKGIISGQMRKKVIGDYTDEDLAVGAIGLGTGLAIVFYLLGKG